MDTRQLKAFIAVADTHSFTKAAEMLDYAQSSITGQVGSLEDELGIKLFERLGRQVMLTREGKRFIVYPTTWYHPAATHGCGGGVKPGRTDRFNVAGAGF